MLNRSMTTAVSGRATAMRRQRRRTSARRVFCSTNGCASFLEVDLETGVATCPICGLQRLVH